jgi:hypothetical protein
MVPLDFYRKLPILRKPKNLETHYLHFLGKTDCVTLRIFDA